MYLYLPTGADGTYLPTYLGRYQGCSFAFSCGDLSPHNLVQKRPKILNLSEKVCQIRGKIVKFKDFDGRYLLWAVFTGSAPTTRFEKLRPWTTYLPIQWRRNDFQDRGQNQKGALESGLGGPNRHRTSDKRASLIKILVPFIFIRYLMNLVSITASPLT